MMFPRIYPLALAITLFAAGCGKSKAPESASASSETKGPTQTQTVSVVRVTSREVSAAVQATGSYVAQESSNVAPQSSGVLVATPVDVGSFVQQGQLIARLDDRDAKLRLDQALAQQQQ